MGDLEDKATQLLQLIAAQPMDFDAHFQLGIVQHRRGLVSQACQLLRQALLIKPGNASARKALGVALLDGGDYAEAGQVLRQAHGESPQDPDICGQLGMLAEVLERTEEAQGWYRAALAIDPHSGDAWRALARVKTWLSEDDELQQMIAAARASDDSVQINFALGKVRDDLRQYDKAMACYRAANEAQADQLDYDSQSQANFFARHHGLNAATLKSLAADAVADETPIFITGLPRSGTSLVEQILASHPRVCGAGEVEYSHLWVDACTAASGQPFPGGIEQIPGGLMGAATRQYLARLKRHAPAARRVVDKLPHNFLRIGLITTLLPQSTIIVCEREPRDLCLSIFQQYFAGEHGYACDLRDLGHYYQLYRGLMGHWEREWPGRLLRVQYEALVKDSESEIRRLLAACQLPFDDQCLEFHRTRRLVYTPSAAQVRRPLYGGSVGRWRNYEAYLAPLIEALEEGSH
jgi:tetratricopeptide (TPR) repeat protein